MMCFNSMFIFLTPPNGQDSFLFTYFFWFSSFLSIQVFICYQLPFVGRTSFNILFSIHLLTVVLIDGFSSAYLRISLFCLVFEGYFSRIFSFGTLKIWLRCLLTFIISIEKSACQSDFCSFESNVSFSQRLIL